MPKIIVREKDLTSAGSQQYSNFAVLVPGFVQNTEAFDKVADENGVYEVSSLADFELNVGTITAKANAVSSGSFAITKKQLALTENDELEPDDEGLQLFTKLTFDTVKANKLLDGTNLYYIKESAEYPGTSALNKKGYIESTQDNTKVYYKVTKLLEVSDEIVWELDQASSKICVSLAPNGSNETTYDGVVALVSEGYNGSAEVDIYHYGNKMAYELIALGYTVLYKKIEAIGELEAANTWQPLKDKAAYDFRYVVTGLLTDNLNASKKILDLCKYRFDDTAVEDTNTNYMESGRGDCFALIDIDEKIYGTSKINQYEAVDAIKGCQFYSSFANESGKYAMLCTPSVTYKALAHDYDDNQMPASFHYLACAAKAFRSYNEWYAVAGYNRGVSDLVIESTKVRFGDYAVNALQPRKREEACSAINVICQIRNNYYLWGNRTAFYDATEIKSPTGLVASDFLNIRQLCTTIKKQLYFVCRRFTFDPNSDVLWVNFISAIAPLLEKMKADQGIEAYKIVKINTNQKGKMMARIRIIPIEAVEDFDICLTLEDSVSGTVVSFND